MKDNNNVDSGTKTINFEMDFDLYEDFKYLLNRNHEDVNEVFNRLVREYVINSFAEIADQHKIEAKSEPIQDSAMFYGMAIRRIPKWAKKPNQINHKIIRAYLQLHAENEEPVTYAQLADYCGDRNRPDVYVPTFNSNFAQMKFDGPKSHGKVFEVDENGVVTVWEPVLECLREYAENFLPGYNDIYYTGRT